MTRFSLVAALSFAVVGMGLSGTAQAQYGRPQQRASSRHTASPMMGHPGGMYHPIVTQHPPVVQYPTMGHHPGGMYHPPVMQHPPVMYHPPVMQHPPVIYQQEDPGIEIARGILGIVDGAIRAGR